MEGRRLAHDWIDQPLPPNAQIHATSWPYSAFAFLHFGSIQQQGLTVGEHSGIYEGTFFEVGECGQVAIGRYSTIVGAIIRTGGCVSIGDYVFIAHEVVIADDDLALPGPVDGPLCARGPTLGDAWTDEWARSGVAVDDWDFGVTTRDRQPKPALAALTAAYQAVPFPDDLAWPRISVVCCSYNGAKFITDCLEGLTRQDYPDFEVIVIDDGSVDETATIAARYDVRLTSQENKGLSAARNEGMKQATGEITAYIDDDAYPDPDWLRYIAWVYMSGDFDGAGGPNLPPPGDGEMADLVALAPGGPNHVLITDTVAEHVPGCNSTYRTEALRAVGGYDTRFRTAGDDVDVGWRIQQNGGTIGFSPGAMVWHHRRGSAKGYLKQQRGYGYAEALLERKWPSRFNRLGHITWPGQLYGPGSRPAPMSVASIYGGSWGSAPFQSLYERGSHWAAAPLMPEWWMAIIGLVVAGLIGLVVAGLIGLTWSPLLWAWPLALLMAGASVVVSLAVAVDGLRYQRLPTGDLVRRVLMLSGLVLGQSLYWTRGRLAGGLTPFRRRGASGFTFPRQVRLEEWSEEWQSMEARLRVAEEHLIATGAAVRCGGDYETWDLEVRTGSFASARLIGTIEEHGHGQQMVRWRIWPYSTVALALSAVLGVSSALVGVDLGEWTAAFFMVLGSAVLLARAFLDAAVACHALEEACAALRADRSAGI